MKRQFIISLSAIAGCVLLSACGDDVTKVTNVTNEVSGMEIVASADSLGKCDSNSLGKTVFASDENGAYVCADSGWVSLSQKASDGKDGASCLAEMLSDSSGYKIVCGEDSVGVIKNGVDGNGCTLADNGDGTVTQVCGKDTVTLYKAFCAGKPYDPASYRCHENDLFDFFVDTRDGQEYRMVTIGKQAWMADNLNFEYNEGTAKSFCYNDDPESCETYGRLYTWSAAMDSAAVFSETGKDCGYGVTCSASETVQGVCPEGWHLPSKEEWATLETYIANSLFDDKTDSIGYALKSTSGWTTGNGSDTLGFGALPAGVRRDETFINVLEGAYFWSSTEDGESYANRRYLGDNVLSFYTGYFLKNYALSIRCVKD